jgi:sphingomyelin phosphodiesterase 3
LVTPEKERLNSVFIIKTLAKFSFWMFITILMTPIGLSFYFIWFILFRKYFRNLSYNLSDNNSNPLDLNNNGSATGKYEILSFNVCLLPDTIARMNNLYDSKNRAQLIGEILSKPNKNGNNLSKNVTSKDNVKIVDYIDQNNDFDFICLQEVWSIDMGERLAEILHKKYKYVIFDAGHNTFKTNKYIGFDSGLLIASKYPIMDVKFQQFKHKVGACSLTGKGVLTAKVNKNIEF